VTAMVLATLLTATVVSCFGVIAFIGLVVPHLVRLWVGENETHLLPASAAFGALFLLVCDTLARTLLSPVVLPVGIVTSMIGAPLFLILLMRK
jgi:iron complex transport system permease protein